MKNIKDIRLEACYTIQEQAMFADIAVGLISEIETGKAKNISFKTVEKLANLHHAYRDEIHKQFNYIPKDLFYRIVNSEKSFDEIRAILKQAGV